MLIKELGSLICFPLTSSSDAKFAVESQIFDFNFQLFFCNRWRIHDAAQGFSENIRQVGCMIFLFLFKEISRWFRHDNLFFQIL